MLLIPKGNADNRGIGLMDTVWKVVEEVIYTRIKTVVQLHNVLHRFCARMGTGTTIMELK